MTEGVPQRRIEKEEPEDESFGLDPEVILSHVPNDEGGTREEWYEKLKKLIGGMPS